MAGRIRNALLISALGVALVAALPAAAGARDPGPCGNFRAPAYGGGRAHVEAKVHTGPVGCKQARQVLRYAIGHKPPPLSNTGVASPPGWQCAHGGPGLFPAVAGYSCEASKPRRVIVGRFLD